MSKDLKTRVKVDTKSAVTSLNALEKKIKRIDALIHASGGTSSSLRSNLNKAVTPTRQIANEANRMNNNFKKSSSSVSMLTSKVKKLASAYLGVMGMKAMITTSDTITSAENRLNALNGGNTQQTQNSLDKMYVSAQNSRMGYSDMISNASKSMTLASEAFQDNIDNAIRFQEIMSKSYTLGGASAAEQSSSMYQMIQALGSGVLQGDELRSVREGAPLAYKAIEEFAQGVYKTEDSLKDMASQGLITSEMVVAAMMDAGEGIDEAFANTEMTFTQAFNNMKNTAIKSFEPVLQTLRDALDTELVVGLMNTITSAIEAIAGALGILFSWISNVYNFIVDNWSVISKVLLNIALIIAVLLIPKFIAWCQWLLWVAYYYIYLGACAVASAIKSAIAWAIVNWQLALIILVIVAVITALVWLSDGFADACGIIVGVVFTAGALIYNLFVGVINSILQLCWAFCEPFISIVEWVLNAANGGFNSFGDAVANLIGQVIGWFLSLGKVVTKIIDAIFGTNWTAGLESLKSSVESWGKNDNAITIDRTSPDSGLTTIDYSDAYDTGYNLGYTGAEWITDKVSNLTSSLGIGSLPSTSDSTYDVTGSYNTPSNDDLTKSISNIDDNTSSIADSMDLTEEDLEYLRKIAALEWTKEYTTANITVDMKNYNTVNGENDLDGIVTTLVSRLYEELDSVANGVYA